MNKTAAGKEGGIGMTSGLAFHVHHDKLVEWCSNYEGRQSFIIDCKPVGEQELRLRLFKLIPIELLPPGLDKVCAELAKACAKWDKAKLARASAKRAKAYAERAKAYAELDKALESTAPELAELHKQLCPDCPWDGETIFAERK